MLMGAAAGAGGVVTEVAGIPLLLAAALPVDSPHRSLLRLPAGSGVRPALPAGHSRAFDRQRPGAPASGPQAAHPDGAGRGKQRCAADRLGGHRGRGLTADLALEVVPILGDAVTILLDYSLMKRVNRTARRVFEGRWLRDAAKIDGEIAPALEHPRDDCAADSRRPGRPRSLSHELRRELRRHCAVRARGPGGALAARPRCRGARDGARDAVSVNQLHAGRHRHDDQVPALVPCRPRRPDDRVQKRAIKSRSGSGADSTRQRVRTGTCAIVRQMISIW